MVSTANIFYISLLFLLLRLRCILGDCSIYIPEEISKKPQFYKYVGTHKLKVNTVTSKLVLRENQRFEMYCSSNFEWPPLYDAESRVFLKCRNGYIYTSTDIDHTSKTDYFSQPAFKCSYEKFNLYEANKNFLWCPSNVTSYIVARPEPWKQNTLPWKMLAGICYDIDNLKFYSVYYTLAPNKMDNVQPTALKESFIPGIEIDSIQETFVSNSISEFFLGNDQFKNWITTLNYEYSSIIQHPKYISSWHEQSASLLEFIWWPNLRLYNWKRYTEALERHIENDNKVYDVLAGISGSMKAPILQSCQENYTMREVLPSTQQQVPLYIWNYLRDSSNSSNEVVIIGFNSPFNEFYLQDEIIFCKDKCHEIAWLEKVKSTFRYNIMGTVFCCNVDDVRLSKQLDGFPEAEFNPKLKPIVLSERAKPKLLSAKIAVSTKMHDYRSEEPSMENEYDD